MNRHPYGGYDAPPPRRRSASPPFRNGGGGGGGGAYRGRGAPRGRGGYSGGGGRGEPAPYGAPYANHPPQQDPYSHPPPLAAYAPQAMNGGDYGSAYAPPARDPYYGGGGGPSEYQDYNPHNDGQGSDYGGRGGYDGGGRGRGAPGYGRGGPAAAAAAAAGPRPPRQRDDKIHDSIIEERVSRERPCRTLFIRNIKYESNSDRIREKFEEHGEIKTFFDLIKTRGMVFVTYFDLRAAERARDRLQGMDVSGRPIDVHFSLPREHELSQRCDREKNQGTLLVTLVGSQSRQPIDDNELRRKMQQFGDVKIVKPVYMSGIMRPDQRLVEMFDSRACAHAHDRLRDQSLQDGIMELEFEWDVPDQPLPPGPVPIPLAESRSPPRYSDAPRGPAYRGGPESDRGSDWGDRGPPPRSGPPSYRDYSAGPPERGRDRDYPPNDYRRGSGAGAGGGGGFPPITPIGDRGSAPYAAARGSEFAPPRRDDRFDRDRGRPDDRGFGGRDEWRGGGRRESPMPSRPPLPGQDEFGRALPNGRPAEPDRGGNPYNRSAPPNYPPYNAAPPSTLSANASPEERLQQAKKVQELLAALKPNAASAPAPSAPGPSAPYYGGGPPSGYPPYPPPGGFSSLPPPSTYTGRPAAPPSSTPSSGDVQSLLAMLAQNQSQAGQNR